MIGGSFLSGATSRLLPASIPFRFFMAAVYFHVLAWIMFALASDNVASFIGGLGNTLAAIHLITLGTLSTAAMGASFQLLPVATRAPIASLWQPKLTFWLIFAGAHVLVAGMVTGHAVLLLAGAVICALALALFAFITIRNLWLTPQPAVATAYGWVAVVCLVATLLLGLLLTLDLSRGFFADHSRIALIHLIVAVFGFFGLLTFGFSGLLLPMFALSPAPPSNQSYSVLAAAALSILLAAIAAILALPLLLSVAAAIALATAIAHVVILERGLAKRMRRKLGPSFTLMRVGHAALIAGILGGFVLTLMPLPPRMPALFGWTILAGWLMTFLFGILQRILPFLASMHAGKARGRPPLLSEIGPGGPLTVHAVCHFAALVLVGAGIVGDIAVVIRMGAVVGLVGAIAFLWFAITVVRHILPRQETTQKA
jgi:hypothetical protein